MLRGYHDVKALAGEIGCSIKDLLALSPNNDPFYAGSPARAAAAEWFAGLWERFGFRDGVHLRRVHYVLVSQESPVLKPDGEPYQNTDNDWKELGTASLSARYPRLVPADAFVDRRNPDPIICAKLVAGTPPEIHIFGADPGLALEFPDEMPVPEFGLLGFSAEQDFLVEVWVEKSTMNDVLEPLARRLGFNLVTGVGEMSETSARNAVGRALDARKPLRILYVSDFDPAGRSMPVALARKVEFTIKSAELDLDVILQPIILTPAQCQQYRLPRTPIKETERRAAKFEDRFGTGATELDALEALHPGELARIVEAEVCRYLDPTLERHVLRAKWEFERRLTDVHDHLLLDIRDQDIREIRDRFESIKEDLDELDDDAAGMWRRIALDLKEAAPSISREDIPKPRQADPHPEPLFDSKRDYLTQADSYHTWQGRTG